MYLVSQRTYNPDAIVSEQTYRHELYTKIMSIRNLYNLEESQINKLFQLTLKDGSPMIDGRDIDTTYQYLGLLETIQFEDLYNDTNKYIKMSSSFSHLYHKLSVFEDAKRKLLIEIDNIRDVQEVVDGAYVCSDCSSSKTFSTTKQMSSADEASTIFIVCAACGHRWKKRG